MVNPDKTVEYYLSLPYTIEVIPDVDEDGERVLFARVVELPGCMTEADTFAELGEMIVDAMTAWIEISIEDGRPIPEPRPVEEYSGKFVVRVPKSLHRELAQTAEREGVSLNSFVSASLAKAVGGGRQPGKQNLNGGKFTGSRLESTEQQRLAGDDRRRSGG